MQAQFDCIIAGGGMVGSACAASLAASGWNIALADRQSLKDAGDANSPMVSALNPRSIEFLQQLNVWQQLASDAAAPFETMSVYDNSGGGHIDFAAADIQASHLGYIVNNQRIQYSLRQRFHELGGTLSVPFNMETIQREDKLWRLTSENGDSLHAPLLLAADGGRSWLRQQLNIESWNWPYHQQAIVANLHVEEGHGNRARQWFHPSGILAFLPLADPNRVSIVWSLNDRNAHEAAQLTDERFCQRLQAITGQRLGRLQLVTERIKRPLVMNQAHHYVLDGFALVGDAAHSIHPLAGQGVNLGLRDVASLTSVLDEAKQRKRHYWTYDTLRRYERERKHDAWLMIAAMEVFKRGFVNESQLLAGLRSRGMILADRCHLLKRLFIEFASSGSL